MAQPIDPDLQFAGLAHLVPDLEPVAAQYRTLGFPIAGPHAGPTGTGIRTATWYTRRFEHVEAVGVQDRTQAAAAYPDWATMAQLQQAGGGAGRFHLLVSDVPAVVDQLRTRGVPVAGPIGRSATLESGATVSYMTARVLAGHPWDPFFSSFGVPPAEVFARRQARGLSASPWTIDQLVVATPQPQADAAWLAGVLGVAVAPADAGAHGVAIPGCTLVFRAGPAGRITEVVLDGPHAPTGAVAGLRYQPASPAR